MAKDIDGSEPTSERRERRVRTARVHAEPTVNTLSPTPAAREPEAHEPPAGARLRSSAAAESERPSSAPGTKSSNGAPASFAALPDRILEHYYRIDAKYYLDNGELAFTHRADKLTTPSENSEIVRDLVEIARHNGIHDITVTGTERFKREVWAAATRLGLEVRGYEPTLHDEKQLVRAMAREGAARGGRRGEARGAAPEADESPAAAARAAVPPAGGAGARDDIDLQPTAGGPAPGSTRAANKGSVGRAEASTGRAAGDRRVASESRAYAGELLDHGPEHYQRNPREDMSYYVQVGTANGAIDLWGLDLSRALAEAKSRPKIGDRVVIRQTGQRDVTVRTREFDEAGRFLGERDKEAHRNRWSIEKEDFVSERARLAAVLRDEHLSAERGARAHPQLLGTYFIIKQAEEFAKERFRTREERERFVGYTRERLAQIIERGEALPTTQIRSQQSERTRASSREPLAPQGPGPTLA